MKKLALTALLALLAVCPAKADYVGIQFALTPSPGTIFGPMSGYAAGDTVTLSCNNLTFTTSPKVGVVSVSSGAVTAVAVVNPGVTSSTPPGATVPCSQASTTGAGSGLNINMNVGVIAASVAAPASPDGLPYIAGNWYLPSRIGVLAASANPGSGSIKFVAGVLRQRATITALGIRIAAGSAGNAQIAIYANNPATNKPTGPALASTASLDTTSSNNSLNGSVSAQLDPGLYWFACNIDNGTATLVPVSGNGGGIFSESLGSTSSVAALTATATATGYALAQTFGTWPDVTASGGSMTINQGNTGCAVQFKVGSVP